MLAFKLDYAWHDFSAHYEGLFQAGVTSILGPSGGGKSTLLSLLGGYIEGQGNIQFDQVDLQGKMPFERPITTLFQSDNLFPQLRVWDNVALGISPARTLTSDQKQRVQWALEQVKLQDFAQKWPEQLSGGQAQRVAIARVLVRDQPVLLLDEPFSALDPVLKEEMLSLTKRLTKMHNWLTIMVTHSPQDALTLGGKVMLVEEGEIRAHESVEVLRNPEAHSPFVRYLRVPSYE